MHAFLAEKNIRFTCLFQICHLIKYVDNDDPRAKEVCQFDKDKITGISDPTHRSDVVNKRYVDKHVHGHSTSNA